MGIAGAAAAPASLPASALIGATLATTPAMTGSSIQRQQNSPEALKRSAGERLGVAAGEGLVDSALNMAVPAFMGGKLASGVMRPGAAAATQASKKMLLAQNMSGGIAGEGLAGYGSEALHQNTDSYFDPNRDTSQDGQRRFDAAATGAILGGAFGTVGFAGDLAARRSPGAPRPPTPEGEAAPGLMERARTGTTNMITSARDRLNSQREGVPLNGEAPVPTPDAAPAPAPRATRAADIFSPKEPVNLRAAREAAAGRDDMSSIDPAAYEQASPEGQAEMARSAKQSAVDQTIRMARELYNDRKLTPESRAQLEAMQGDFTNAANRMQVGAMTVAKDAKDAFVKGVDRTHEFINRMRESSAKADGTMRSDMDSNIRKVVSDEIMPYLEENRPDILGDEATINRIGDSVNMFVQMANDGKVNNRTIREMRSIFGSDQLRRIAMSVQEAVSSSDDAASATNFMKAMTLIQREEITSDSLNKSVADALSPEMQEQRAGNPEYIRSVVDGIRAHVDESAYANMGKERADMEKLDFTNAMQAEFGSKSKGLLAIFGKEAGDRSARASDMQAKGPEVSAGRSDDNVRELSDSESIESRLTEGDDISDMFDAQSFVGRGFKNDMVISDRAFSRRGGEGESPQAALMRENTKKFAGRGVVDFVPYDDAPAEFQAAHRAKLGATYRERIEAGDSEPLAIKAANDLHGSPREVGMFRTEGMAQEGRISASDFKEMRVVADSTANLKSPSRINTGEDGAVVRGQTLDAIKMVKMFQSRTERLVGAETGRERLAHVFMEAVAAAQDHMGRAFTIPDATVVQNRGGGNVTTWGEIKGLTGRPEMKGDVKMSETSIRENEATRADNRKTQSSPEQIEARGAAAPCDAGHGDD